MDIDYGPGSENHLVRLVVKASTSRAEDPEFESRRREQQIRGSNPMGIFPGSSHTSDLKIGTPVATLPGA